MSDNKNILKRWSRSWLPAPIAQAARRMTCRWDYGRQLRVARDNFREYGYLYSTPLLFVAGLPKSGTTWLKRMLTSFPGFSEILVPEATLYEMNTGGSHDFDVPEDLFARLDGALAVLKMHVHGSDHNIRILKDAGIPYVVLYRDLRDVAISHYYYVRRTPWHPGYQKYKLLSFEEGIRCFADTLLPQFAYWIRTWQENMDTARSIEVRYEDLVSDTEEVFKRIARLYSLDSSSQVIRRIVEMNRFENLTGGRKKGMENADSFFRKGIVGDWISQFPESLKDIFKESIGDFLVETGYEKNLDW